MRVLIDSGQGFVDYTQYVLDGSLSIEDSINVPTLITFQLAAIDNTFVVPRRSSYVKIISDQYAASSGKGSGKVIATGFVTNEPDRTFLGLTQRLPKYGNQQFAYTINVTSDEWLLNVKTVPYIPAFVNQTQGQILAGIANALSPGFFDTTSLVASGDIIPYFEYDPTKTWSDVAKEFGDGSRYHYKVVNRVISYQPFGDAPLGISYDDTAAERNKFPFELQTNVVTVPPVNDVLVIGDIEPQTDWDDYFVGDGFTSNFQLLHEVFRGASATLLSEDWTGSSFGSNWVVKDPFHVFQLAGALNVLQSGLSGGYNTTYIQAANGIELGGGLNLQHGEFEFTDISQGLLGGIYMSSQFTPDQCLAGFDVDTAASGVITTASGAGGIEITPLYLGQKIGPTITTKPNHHYVLQTWVGSRRWDRYTRVYTNLTQSASYGGNDLVASGDITWVITDIDLGVQTSVLPNPPYPLGVAPIPPVVTQYTVFNADLPSFALYAPINSTDLNLVVFPSTSVFQPPQGELLVQSLTGVSGGLLPVLPQNLTPYQHYLLGFGMQNQTATIQQSGDVQELSFYDDTIPGVGARIRLQSWESGQSLSRVRDLVAIANEAAISGDDGVRSAIMTNLSPLPRSSDECDMAAAAALLDREFPQFQGTYTVQSIPYKFESLFNGGQTDYPQSGRYLYVNSPLRAISGANMLVHTSRIQVIELREEVLTISIDFGPDLYLERLLPSFLERENDLLAPKEMVTPPDPITLDQVGNAFLATPQNAKIVNFVNSLTGNFITVDLGELPVTGCEVRRVDAGWGQQDTNRIGVFTTQQFNLQRTARDQTWYMRFVNGSNKSRFSKALHVNAPLVPSAPKLLSSTTSAIVFDFAGDVRDIYGLELRVSQIAGTTIVDDLLNNNPVQPLITMERSTGAIEILFYQDTIVAPNYTAVQDYSIGDLVIMTCPQDQSFAGLRVVLTQVTQMIGNRQTGTKFIETYPLTPQPPNTLTSSQVPPGVGTIQLYSPGVSGQNYVMSPVIPGQFSTVNSFTVYRANGTTTVTCPDGITHPFKVGDVVIGALAIGVNQPANGTDFAAAYVVTAVPSNTMFMLGQLGFPDAGPYLAQGIYRSVPVNVASPLSTSGAQTVLLQRVVETQTDLVVDLTQPDIAAKLAALNSLAGATRVVEVDGYFFNTTWDYSGATAGLVELDVPGVSGVIVDDFTKQISWQVSSGRPTGYRVTVQDSQTGLVTAKYTVDNPDNPTVLKSSRMFDEDFYSNRTITVVPFDALGDGNPTVIAHAASGGAAYYGGGGAGGFTECLDVRAFGAVGDGVTDDTAAVQAALDMAATYAVQQSAGQQPASHAVVCIPSTLNCKVMPQFLDGTPTGSVGFGPIAACLRIASGVTLRIDGVLSLGGSFNQATGHMTGGGGSGGSSGGSGGASGYDMLQWMLLDPSLRASNHMEGIKPLSGNSASNHAYYQMDSNKYYVIKGDSGYPWDINLFDDNYVYLSTTELSYTSASQGKRFEYGIGPILTGVPFAKRFMNPGDFVLSTDSHFKIYTSCGQGTITQLGDVRCELSGPFTEDYSGTLGANIPSVQTIVIKYRWGGQGHTTGIYLTQEEYHFGYDPVGNIYYGLVMYQAENWNSATQSYDPPFNQVIHNKLVSGSSGLPAVDPCGFGPTTQQFPGPTNPTNPHAFIAQQVQADSQPSVTQPTSLGTAPTVVLINANAYAGGDSGIVIEGVGAINANGPNQFSGSLSARQLPVSSPHVTAYTVCGTVAYAIDQTLGVVVKIDLTTGNVIAQSPPLGNYFSQGGYGVLTQMVCDDQGYLYFGLGGPGDFGLMVCLDPNTMQVVSSQGYSGACGNITAGIPKYCDNCQSVHPPCFGNPGDIVHVPVPGPPGSGVNGYIAMVDRINVGGWTDVPVMTQYSLQILSSLSCGNGLGFLINNTGAGVFNYAGGSLSAELNPAGSSDAHGRIFVLNHNGTSMWLTTCDMTAGTKNVCSCCLGNGFYSLNTVAGFNSVISVDLGASIPGGTPSIGPCPDGTQIIASAGSDLLYKYDPVSQSITATLDLSTYNPIFDRNSLRSIDQSTGLCAILCGDSIVIVDTVNMDITSVYANLNAQTGLHGIASKVIYNPATQSLMVFQSGALYQVFLQGTANGQGVGCIKLQGCSQVTVRGVQLQQHTLFGIYASSCTEIEVTEVTSPGNLTQAGVLAIFDRCTDCAVVDCLLDGTSSYGLTFVADYAGQGIHINSNSIYKYSGDGVRHADYGFEDGQQVSLPSYAELLISDNEFIGGTQLGTAAINIVARGLETGITITNNVIGGNKQSGVVLGNLQGLIFSKNQVLNNTTGMSKASGTLLEKSTILDNLVMGNSLYDIPDPSQSNSPVFVDGTSTCTMENQTTDNQKYSSVKQTPLVEGVISGQSGFVYPPAPPNTYYSILIPSNPSTNPLAQSGTSASYTVSAFEIQWPDKTVSYSGISTPVSPPHGYATYYVFVDDPYRKGDSGATYGVTTVPQDLATSAGRYLIGVITLAPSGGGTGSGYGNLPGSASNLTQTQLPTTQPYDIGCTYNGTALSGTYVVNLPMVRQISFATNLVPSRATLQIPPATGTYTISVRKNGVEFGQITFTLGATVAAITGTATVLNPGDQLQAVSLSNDNAAAGLGMILSALRAFTDLPANIQLRLADSTNFWADSLATMFPALSLVLSDNMNNWADVFVKASNALGLQLSDSMNNWADAFKTNSPVLSLTLSDSNANNWVDFAVGDLI